MQFEIRLKGSEETHTVDAFVEEGALAEEIAFEHEFHVSSTVLRVRDFAAARWAVDCATAIKDELPEPPCPPEAMWPVEWLSFFGWRALRRAGVKVAATFPAFYESVAHFDALTVVEDDDDDGDDSETAGADELAREAASLEFTGSGLDPTERAVPHTPPPSSS